MYSLDNRYFMNQLKILRCVRYIAAKIMRINQENESIKQKNFVNAYHFPVMLVWIILRDKLKLGEV